MADQPTFNELPGDVIQRNIANYLSLKDLIKLYYVNSNIHDILSDTLFVENLVDRRFPEYKEVYDNYIGDNITPFDKLVIVYKISRGELVNSDSYKSFGMKRLCRQAGRQLDFSLVSYYFATLGYTNNFEEGPLDFLAGLLENGKELIFNSTSLIDLDAIKEYIQANFKLIVNDITHDKLLPLIIIKFRLGLLTQEEANYFGNPLLTGEYIFQHAYYDGKLDLSNLPNENQTFLAGLIDGLAGLLAAGRIEVIKQVSDYLQNYLKGDQLPEILHQHLLDRILEAYKLYYNRDQISKLNNYLRINLRDLDEKRTIKPSSILKSFEEEEIFMVNSGDKEIIEFFSMGPSKLYLEGISYNITFNDKDLSTLLGARNKLINSRYWTTKRFTESAVSYLQAYFKRMVQMVSLAPGLILNFAVPQYLVELNNDVSSEVLNWLHDYVNVHLLYELRKLGLNLHNFN